MTTSDEISIIANKLANEGKTPSVALIKSQLKQSVPLPQIISILKNWQHDPKFIQKAVTSSDTKKSDEVTASSTELNLLIAEAIAPLQQEILQLKKLVNQLIDNQRS